jgi:hypothetical protein
VKIETPTLPPEFTGIARELCGLWREALEADMDGTELADVLSVEEVVVAFTRELARTMLQQFVDVRQAQATSQAPLCGCGNERSAHRITRWQRQTMVGPIVVSDPYLYCRDCRQSARPLHERLGTSRETWSLMVQEAAVDLATDESCEKATAKLERHHPGVSMERTTALRLLHEHGSRAREFIDDKLAHAATWLEEPTACSRADVPRAEELEVEFDGGMIPVATFQAIETKAGEEPERTPIRGLLKRRKACAWQEVKVGLAQKPGEIARLYSLRPTAELDRAFDDLRALASMKGLGKETQVRGLADGAVHIRPRMEETFADYTFRFILDRPHAKEHLSSAGEALAPLTGANVQDWAKDALTRLESGRAQDVVDELHRAWVASGIDESSRNDTLRREANYFERNKDAVAYAEYREHKWSTASSEVESSHRSLVQSRLKIPGAWWHPDHVDDILALRMLKGNGWWQEYWHAQRNAWKTKARELTKDVAQAA